MRAPVPDRESMKIAIKMVYVKKLSVRMEAKRYGVSKSTLFDHVKK
jgi:transposase-like protein